MTDTPEAAAISDLLGQAIEQHRGFAFDEAERLYRAVLAQEPAHADALHNLGVLYAIGLGRPLDALVHFEAALNVDAGRAQFWFSYVDGLIRAEQGEMARQVLPVAQAHGLPMAMVNSLHERLASNGLAPQAAGPGDAQRSLVDGKDGLPGAEHPTSFAARMQRAQEAFALGNLQDEQGLLDDAESSFRSALALDPDFADALTNLALVRAEQGDFVQADGLYRRALALQPEAAPAHYNLGVNLFAQQEWGEAEMCFRRALQWDPDFQQAQIRLAQLLQGRGRWVDAETLWRDWLRRHPRSALGFEQLGQVLRHLQRLEDALQCMDQALLHGTEPARLHHQRAEVFKAQGRFGEAEAACRSALALDESSARGWAHLADVFNAARRLTEAEHAFRRAAELDPAMAAAHANLGLTLQNQGRFHDSEACMRRALALKPTDRAAHGNLLFLLNYHPDKTGEQVFTEYQAYERNFFLHLREQWQKHTNAPLHRPDGSMRRLKVGYVSPDFRHHAVTNFLKPLLAQHDRSVVSLHAYAELRQEDAATAEYKRLVDHWVPTRGMGDAALAERIRSDGIDILVDLAGHTGGNRLDVFARKPAPVSVTWMGYGYTTGLSAIDYFLTDAQHAPEGSEGLFSETPWRLPCAFVYRPAGAAAMGEPGPLAAERNGFVTFGTLTRAIRLNDRTVQAWARVLLGVPGSRLLVDSSSYSDVETREALAARFMAHGVARERLEIGFHSPPWDTLRGVDIGLDCFPHNSGTTLFESLYMGIPFVTLASRPSVGRLGSSILHGLGHPEWIATTEDGYVDAAVRLARDVPRLAALRHGLRAQMQASPLMAEAAFAREVESAYRAMFERWQQGHAS